eukprot:2167992-Rhodomonas_salina.3
MDIACYKDGDLDSCCWVGRVARGGAECDKELADLDAVRRWRFARRRASTVESGRWRRRAAKILDTCAKNLRGSCCRWIRSSDRARRERRRGRGNG